MKNHVMTYQMKSIQFFKLLSLTTDVEEGDSVNDTEETLGTAAINNTVTDVELKFDIKIKSENIQLKNEISQAKFYSFNIQ